MDLQQLMTFCTVISEGGMTAAANKLSLSQPAISQQILALEKELGVKVLIRSARHIRLTVQGQVLYNYAKTMLSLTQEMEKGLHKMSDELEGNIQIATLNSIGLNFITPIIGTILNPNQRKLKMGLFYGTGTEVIEKMKRKEVDIAILPNLKEEYRLELTEYKSQFLFKDELVFVGSGKDNSLPLNLSLKDLNTKPFVTFKNLFPNFRYHLSHIVEQNGLTVHPVLESNNIGTLKKIIETWMCWGFLPNHSIYKQIRMGRLTLIELEDVKYSMNITAYYPHKMPEKRQQVINTFLMLLQKQHYLS